MTEIIDGTSLARRRRTRTHRVIAPGGGWDVLVADESAVVVVAHYIDWHHVEWACAAFGGEIDDDGPSANEAPHWLVSQSRVARTGEVSGALR